MPTRHLRSAVLALVAAAFVAALPAAAQMQVDSARQPVRVIDVEAKVTNLDSQHTERYSVTPAEHVPLRVGDRVRVQIVGTALRDGRGVEEVLPAEFDVVAGAWRIEVAPAGDDAAVVVARQPNEVVKGGAPEGSRSQLGFRIGGAYEMKDDLRNGRVTFDIEAAQQVRGPSSSDPRWRMAEETADVLSEVLLDERQALPELYVERIYVQGYRGMQQVAEALARWTEEQGVLREWSDEEVVTHLYRHLLGREGSDLDVREADPRGVTGNIELLRRRGYVGLVQSFLTSPEFKKLHGIDDIHRLRLDPDAVDRNRHRGPLPEYGSVTDGHDDEHHHHDDDHGDAHRTRPRGSGR